MFPLIIDSKKVQIALVGTGDLAALRLGELLESGVENIKIYSNNPSTKLKRLAGTRLIKASPTDAQLKQNQIIYIAGLDEKETIALSNKCQKLGILISVEEDKNLSSFHTPGVVRRGDLLFSVSTGGKSPALRKRIDKIIAHMFGPEWAGRLDILSSKRKAWRDEKLGAKEITKKTNKYINDEEWL